MSLLTMCKNTADEIGIVRPSVIIGNSEETATRLHRIAMRTGILLAQMNWHELIKTATITTVADEPQYALPSDYRSLVPNTIWNDTNDTPIFIISPQEWGYEKASVTTNYYDRIRLLGDDGDPDIGRKVTIHPTPSAAESIIYQYYSKNWMTDVTTVTEKAAFTADTDLVVFDEELFTMGMIWRMLKTMGQPYIEEKVEYDRFLEMAFARSGATEKLYADGNQATLSNIPETGFGS